MEHLMMMEAIADEKTIHNFSRVADLRRKSMASALMFIVLECHLFQNVL